MLNIAFMCSFYTLTFLFCICSWLRCNVYASRNSRISVMIMHVATMAGSLLNIPYHACAFTCI